MEPLSCRLPNPVRWDILEKERFLTNALGDMLKEDVAGDLQATTLPLQLPGYLSLDRASHRKLGSRNSGQDHSRPAKRQGEALKKTVGL